MTPHGPGAQRGGMISLLLALLAIGAALYFVLRGGGGSPGGTGLGSDASAVSCEQQISKLVARTGGHGPEYRAGYEALPPSCRGLLPAPGALDPSAARAEPEG